MIRLTCQLEFRTSLFLYPFNTRKLTVVSLRRVRVLIQVRRCAAQTRTRRNELKTAVRPKSKTARCKVSHAGFLRSPLHRAAL